MIVCGLVVEYNPFHYGHLYHLNQAKKLTNADIVVVVMSPTFMQRGEPAIIDKQLRCKSALEHGVDVVVELPSLFAVQSANHFAHASIKLLNEMDVDYIVFGSENNNIDMLYDAARVSLSNEYQNLVKEYVKNGQRYANACNMAFKDFNITSISDSNDILGLAYIQEILKHNYNIKALSIKRTNEYLSTKVDTKHASATAIRYNLQNNINISKLTPNYQTLIENKEQLVYLKDLFFILKYKLFSTNATYLKDIHGFDEGLEYLFLNNIDKAKDIEDFISLCTSKRYPKTRVQRAIFYLISNLLKTDYQDAKLDYLRILGFSLIGQKYLKMLKEKTDFNIITTFSNHKSKVLDFELRVSKIYSLLSKDTNHQFIDLQKVIIYK